ncbi:50S ribosomal protein L13 [Algiphilus sp.]|uniref:50S ribosomal protein L13 n=1 Tax=Algiphilus sp. TaxID=1872431 RepID=UPI001CA602FE|nr:50S ribosomal protein L13 [Algiphilus sp.]MBY8964876.1 50S ribosomal protein L13 [Algiphilus acroporae]MCI5062103.1 50S ribosomal protein L13 [Algiphilus sp.]MCI5102546.1 50S ribosomal protein L13 [Algiphilus sp.]MCR9090563.1 50S ribosomal protein L13 [Pseudomonadota bacterium]
MQTTFANAQTAKRDWVIFDAEGQTLGRLASEIARRLRGKHKPEFTPHADVGDYVVVINADKVRVTGRKMNDKIYWRHTGYPGGIRSRTLSQQLERHPERVLQSAVRGMLPRGPLGYAQFGKLKVYAGSEHPHTAQQPAPVSL